MGMRGFLEYRESHLVMVNIEVLVRHPEKEIY